MNPSMSCHDILNWEENEMVNSLWWMESLLWMGHTHTPAAARWSSPLGGCACTDSERRSGGCWGQSALPGWHWGDAAGGTAPSRTLGRGWSARPLWGVSGGRYGSGVKETGHDAMPQTVCGAATRNNLQQVWFWRSWWEKWKLSWCWTKPHWCQMGQGNICFNFKWIKCFLRTWFSLAITSQIIFAFVSKNKIKSAKFLGFKMYRQASKLKSYHHPALAPFWFCSTNYAAKSSWLS